jgi:hypothetical protein
MRSGKRGNVFEGERTKSCNAAGHKLNPRPAKMKPADHVSLTGASKPDSQGQVGVPTARNLIFDPASEVFGKETGSGAMEATRIA